MSDTPRTESFNCYDNGCDNPLHAWGAFSAELERELNASTSEIDRLTAKVAQLYEGAEEQKQRIKRLEETLEAVTDKLDNAWGIYMNFKEAK
jgi:septal ring factor EnvC (AmiA/AmiB activator)